MSAIATDSRLLKELPRGVQLQLQVKDPRSRPLGDVNAAMLNLDMSDEEIHLLIEQGFLLAFNIAAPRSETRCLRILTKSVDLFRETRGRKRLELEWPDAFKLIFGRCVSHPALTGLEIKRGLNCTRQHVGSLTPCFKVINEAKQGRGNTPSFTTASVEHWLKGRQL